MSFLPLMLVSTCRSRFSSVRIVQDAGPGDHSISNAPSASTLVNSWTDRFSVTMWPLPLMPLRWQPPRQRAANVSNFAAAKGRIGMVLIGINLFGNEMRLQDVLDSGIFPIWDGLSAPTSDL